MATAKYLIGATPAGAPQIIGIGLAATLAADTFGRIPSYRSFGLTGKQVADKVEGVKPHGVILQTGMHNLVSRRGRSCAPL
jgi:hypothetical protein